jgi:peptidylprolyl isomerase/FKBP-type peptidyl-prolyl cis-trans isomerase FklB
MRTNTLVPALLALALLGAAPAAALAQGAPPAPAANAPTAAQGQAFLAKNKTEPGVVTLPDGLQYKVMVAGDPKGGSPGKDDLVAVHYEGKLLDGTTFDASVDEDEPAIFQLGGLIPAWVEAMSLMHPGDQWEIWSPPELAYGDKEDEQIPANSVLDFRIQLIDFLPAARQTAQG